MTESPTHTPGWDLRFQQASAELDRRLRAGETRAAEAVLAAYPELANDPDSALQLIYEELVLRERLGEQPAYAEYYGRFPQWHNELRKSFDVHEALVRGGVQTVDQASAPVSATEAAGTAPAAAGRRYELLGELGRGGMGVVYRARQPGLKRLVALKMILAGHDASAEGRTRFRIEAEAIARLQHPNIVQVYEVGEQDGQPFLALEYVDGGSLAQKLNGTPLPLREAAQLLETLARAVHYAHEHGVLHRDLKPANILLQTTEHTEDTEQRQNKERKEAKEKSSALQPSLPSRSSSVSSVCSVVSYLPKITDFGLAKCFPSKACVTTVAGPTQTGQLLGTPSYMAPEQAQGELKAIGPATDVYALGTILYECLTGRPPFQGETVMATLLLVREQEPVSPRRLQPKVPRDLETICLKCLEKEPERRYARAAELAEDLRRFLAGEAIRARPVGIGGRTWKWARRRPALAALVTVSGLAAVTLVAVVLSYNTRLRGANQNLTSALAATLVEKQRAESNLTKARAAVDRMLTRVGDWHLHSVPGMERMRRNLLQDALKLYQEILKENPTDSVARRESGQAHKRLADLHVLLGELGPAEQAYRQAIAVAEQLVAEDPSAPDYRADVAGGYLGLDLLLRQTARRVESEQANRRGLGLLERLIAEFPDRPQYRHELASARLSLSQLLANTGYPEEAERGYQQALAAWQQLVAEFPGKSVYRVDLAMLLNNLGLLYMATGRHAEAEQAFRQSLVLRERLAAEAPEDFVAQQYRASLLNNLGSLFHATRRLDEAEQAFRQALPLYAKMAEAFPSVPLYSQQRARCLHNLASTLVLAGRYEEAEQCGRRALALLQKLATGFPTIPEYQYELASSHNTLGCLLQSWNRPKEADQAYRQALAVLERLVAASPDEARFQSQLADTLHNLGALQLAGEEVAEARRLAEQAVRWQKKALEHDPKQAIYRQSLSGHLWLLGQALGRLGRHVEAAEVAAELARDFSDSVPPTYLAVCLWGRCAACAARATDLPAARRQELVRAYGDRAMQALRDLVQRGYGAVDQLRSDSDLDALRSRDDFQQLLRELEQKVSAQEKG